MNILRQRLYKSTEEEIQSGCISPEAIRRLIVISGNDILKPGFNLTDFVWMSFKSQNPAMYESLRKKEIVPKFQLICGLQENKLDMNIMMRVLELEFKSRRSAYIQSLKMFQLDIERLSNIMLITVFDSSVTDRRKSHFAAISNSIMPLPDDRIMI